MPRLSLKLAAAWLAALVLLAPSAPAQSSQYKLEAAYLCRFLDFVAWPPDAFTNADSPLVIGVLGRDPFGQALDQVARGQTCRGRSILVRRFTRLSDAQHCQLLYISSDGTPRLDDILAALAGRPILTVSDTRDFAERGGMIRFFTDNNKLRFRINLEAAKSGNLSISSRLLQLADVIKGGQSAP